MDKTKQYDLIVYIGRFQIFHNGHLNILQNISHLAKKTLVLIGSSTSPKTLKNPFTYYQREQMIRESTHIQYLEIDGIEDFTYDNNRWIAQVTHKVSQYADGDNIAIAGFDKDKTSSYLKYFPQWDLVEQREYREIGTPINASDLREELYKGNLHYIKGNVPSPVLNFIVDMDWSYFIKEYNELIKTKQKYGLGPFVTTDAIVIQSGHILLIKRKDFGEDLWAMPGGFLNINETLEQGVMRELREETGLKVPEKVLKGSILSTKIFDDPDRDLRGRIITHAYVFKLDDREKLPRIKGADDAKHAEWIPIATFYEMQSVMFADHYAIIESMIGGI
jgi:bifunctional NMN adenylyltransferase/nudix hydrolase